MSDAEDVSDEDDEMGHGSDEDFVDDGAQESSSDESFDEEDEDFDEPKKKTKKKPAAPRKPAVEKKAKKETKEKKEKKEAAPRKPAAKKETGEANDKKPRKAAAPATTTPKRKAVAEPDSGPRGASKKPKVKTVSDAEGTRLILQYINEQNRPYAHLQVFENLHGVVKKTQVPKSLDKLADDGLITCKSFGKNKVYVANQVGEALNQEELDSMDAKMQELSEEVSQSQATVRALESDIAGISSEPTNKEADAQIAALESELKKKSDKLALMQSGNAPVVTMDEVKHSEGAFRTSMSKWKKFKRAAREMIDTVLESSDQSKQSFMEDQGIEDDADANVDISQWDALLKGVK